MSECHSCGARVSTGEHFCGNCGSQLLPSSSEFKTVAPDAGDKEDLPVREGREWATTLDPTDETPIIPAADETPTTAEQPVYQPPAKDAASAEMREPSGSLETTVVGHETEEPTPISSNSLGGSFTDSVHPPSSAPEKSTTGGH